MAKPQLALIPFHSNSYPHCLFPSYALYFLITVLYLHHNQSILISPSVPASLGTWFSLSFSIQSWWNQPKYIHHSKLSPTISHHPLVTGWVGSSRSAYAMPWLLARHSSNEGVLRSNSACSMLMSDDLRLPRRGIEPRPSGFRDIGSTARPCPSPV